MDLQVRLKEYLKYKGLTNKEFEQVCGLSNGTAARLRATTRESTLNRIANSCDLNTNWLLTGDGEMISNPLSSQSETIATEKDSYLVPLLPVEAFANPFGDFWDNGVIKSDCSTIISPMHGADFAITISGDSMEPKFHDGTIIFIKKINDAAFIPWGNVMVLDTENRAFVKEVYPGVNEETIEARSTNPKYPPMQIPKDSIFGMYRVLNATKFFTTM